MLNNEIEGIHPVLFLFTTHIDKLIIQRTGIPVYITDSPLNAVVRGTGIALKNIDKFTFLLR